MTNKNVSSVPVIPVVHCGQAALKIRDWAKRRGRTGKAWFICALLFMIPTIIVLLMLPKLPVITMQHSSQHKIDLNALD